MTSASMTFGRPARLTIPRGALWFAGGDADLSPHEIDASYRFGNPMLNLNARIDFHKIKLMITEIK